MMQTNPLPDPEAFQPIENIALPVRAELDRRTIQFEALLNLQEGDVISFSRAAGENINIYIGGVLIGWGEVLLLEGTLGVRIADLRDAAPPPPEEHDNETLRARIS